jgi:hypothetical protein
VSRIVCWFSCGAASAMATKIAIEQNARRGQLPIVVARCRVDEEHPDNDRFAADCEAWFGLPITNLSSEKFGSSIYNVFEKERYLAGIAGAPCTRALKKRVREAFQRPGDLHVFGYSVEEQKRVDDFIDANNEVKIWAPLIERGLTHEDCLAIVARVPIELPAMYKLGYKHNNCIGCVKGGAGYWNKIRVDFPAAFERMAEIEGRLGVRLVKDGGKRVSLRDLRPGVGKYELEPEPSCGVFCEMAEKELIA